MTPSAKIEQYEIERDFGAVHEKLLGVLSLDRKFPETETTKHVATILHKALTEQRDSLLRRCALTTPRDPLPAVSEAGSDRRA